MRRALVLTLALVATAGCQYATSIAPEATPVALRTGDPVSFTRDGFHVHFDPTVMVWADEVHIDFVSVVRRSLDHIGAMLHGPPVSIYIAAGSYLPIPDIGIGGATDRRTGEVRISMDSRRPTPVAEFLRVWVPVALAHELHHSRRIVAGPGYGSTLLDAIVTEGLAEAFVREAYPGAPAIPWVAPLSATEKAAVWTRLQPLLAEPDDLATHQTWFVGGGSLPRWPGYRLGYELARNYLARHPGETAARLSTVGAAQIFAGSGPAGRKTGNRAP